MTDPTACAHTDLLSPLPGSALRICATCGASLVDENGTIRLATAADTTTLTAAELQTLRAARKRTR
jgi:hypothetical protein